MAKLIYTDSSGQEMTVPFGAEQPVVSIGRATDCTIRSNRKSVSRHHAEFRYQNGQYEIVDLQSSNGTYLIVQDNRQPVKPRARLSHTDEVWCGDFILYFYDEDADALSEGDILPYESAHDAQGYAAQSGFGAQPAFGAQPYVAPAQHLQQYAQPPHQAYGNPTPYPPPQVQGNMMGYGNNAQPAPGYVAPELDPYEANTPPPQPIANFQAAPQPGSPQLGAPQLSAQPYIAQPTPAPGFIEPPYAPDLGPDALISEPELLDEVSAEDDWRPDDTSHDHSAADILPYLVERGGDAQVEQAAIGALQQEKARLQQLNTQQAQELEALRQQQRALTRELDMLRSQSAAQNPAPPADAQQALAELEAARQEQRRLEEKLHGALQQVARAQDLQREAEQALAQVAELTQARDHAAHQSEAQRQRADALEAQASEANTLQALLAQRDDALRDQAADLDALRAQLEQAQARASAGQGASAELESLRREQDRQRRLLDEFERRNRELQGELSAAEETERALRLRLSQETEQLATTRDDASHQEASLRGLTAELEQNRQAVLSLRQQLQDAQAANAQHDAHRADLEQQLEDARGTRDRVLRDLDATRTELEQIRSQDSDARALHHEVEGLKQRLKLDKSHARDTQRALEAQVAELQAQLTQAQAQLQDVRAALAHAPAPAASAPDPALLERLRADVDRLARIVDAIERADLGPLGTVDRVRLRSAIRDTAPGATLAALRDALDMS